MRLVLMLFFAAALLYQAEQSVSGRWEGSVQIPDRELKLIVDLAQDATGAWIGSLIIPGLGVKGMPLTEIAAKDANLSFATKTGPGLQVTLKGHLNADGTLSGDFVQAGNTAPFLLKKIGPPEVEVQPKRTAIDAELEGEWKGEYELFGYPRKVTIKLSNRKSEGATAEFVVVGRKTNNLPVDLVTQESELVTIDSHATGISYEGRFKKETNEIQGTFIQGPIEIPLVLRRAK